MKFAIVAIGYNRVKSMERLLNSVNNAFYDDDNVTLYISIDNSGSSEVEELAHRFQWDHGKKIILTYPERLGLRRHILQCGDLVKDYDAIAVLEDDVIVAPGFYHYMKEAVEFYCNDDNIAGISLYHYEWNEFASMPFQPAQTKYDAYFIQTAPSLGQVWMKKQWMAFKRWYEDNNEEFGDSPSIPKAVSRWPKTSWKKYHIKYCIENNKYFVFPYKALSSNFADQGTHCKTRYYFLQVSMLVGDKQNYLLPDLNCNDVVIYDGFFERQFKQEKIHGLYAHDICIDLYGIKTSDTDCKYLLTTIPLPYRVLKSFGLHLKPQEQNFIENIPGEEIYLYDTSIYESKNRRRQSIEVFRYHFNLNEKTRILFRCIIDSFKTYFKDYIIRR